MQLSVKASTQGGKVRHEIEEKQLVGLELLEALKFGCILGRVSHLDLSGAACTPSQRAQY